MNEVWRHTWLGGGAIGSRRACCIPARTTSSFIPRAAHTCCVYICCAYIAARCPQALLPLAQPFGDWTLLHRQYPTASHQQATGQAVYCGLLHQAALMLLEWHKAGLAQAATTGLEVLRAICAARPAAVVDM